MAGASTHPDKEARKRGAGRPARRPEGAAPLKVKSTIHLSLEASQRLDVHCSMARMDRSAMVEKLINDHLRRYVVSDRGGDTAGRESGPIGIVSEAS